jgi:hypothetical protein
MCWYEIQIIFDRKIQSFSNILADSVDSRLVFNGSHFPSYIKLDSKTFPRISELTISFWLRIWPKVDSSQYTILFYKTGLSSL